MNIKGRDDAAKNRYVSYDEGDLFERCLNQVYKVVDHKLVNLMEARQSTSRNMLKSSLKVAIGHL